jgi:hypothetical protein
LHINILSGRSLPALFLYFLTQGMAAQEKRAMEVSDIMKFQQFTSPSVSSDSHWVAAIKAIPAKELLRADRDKGQGPKTD